MSKKCTKCGEIKEFSQFGRDKQLKDGLKIYCKPCMSKLQKEYRDKNIEKMRQYGRQKNKEYRAKMTKEQKERYAKTNKKWRTKNSDRLLDYQKQWNEENKKKSKETRRKRGKTKRGTTIRVLNKIKERCNNVNCKDYKNYGGRGIKLNITIEDFEKLYFSSDTCPICNDLFIFDHTKKRRNTHRIDNSKDYTKDNIVIWCSSCHATHHNKLRSNSKD